MLVLYPAVTEGVSDKSHKKRQKAKSITVFFFRASAYEAKCFIMLFGRAFKMTKNGVYFIVMALFFAELFKILIYAN